MNNEPIANERSLHESAVTKRFLEVPNEDSFSGLFQDFYAATRRVFPRAWLRAGYRPKDLTQEVMLIVYRKASQIRDRTLFRAWLFKIARNSLCQHYGQQTREVETVNLEDVSDRVVAAGHKQAGTPAFEFLHWMAFLDSREREVMTLRFIEQWEYHEIAASRAIPIGNGAVAGVQRKKEAGAVFEVAPKHYAQGRLRAPESSARHPGQGNFGGLGDNDFALRNFRRGPTAHQLYWLSN